MRRTLSLILTLVMVMGIFTTLPVTVSAADVSGLTFYLNDDEQSYTLDYCDETVSGDLVIPNTYNGLPVTNIYWSAFRKCGALISSITISENIEDVGDISFSDCENLVAINVHEDNPYFSSVDGVLYNKDKTVLYRYPVKKPGTEYIMPDTVTSIDWSSFVQCENLTSITLPEKMEWIDTEIIYNIPNLEEINVDKDNPWYSSIDGVLFNKDKTWLCMYPYGSRLSEYVIPDTVTDIETYAFGKCVNLISLVIPKGVEDIPNGILAACPNLEKIDVDKNNRYYSSVDGVLFNKDKSLLLGYPIGNKNSEYIIPDTVKSIDWDAFDECVNLESITISKNVKDIEGWTFDSCENLVSINVDENNSWYSSENGVLFNKDKTSLIRYPIGNPAKEYEVPNRVTAIDDYAFMYNINLESITFPDGLISIGYMSFNDCKSLKEILIPEGVKSIDVSAFYSCNELVSIVLPDSLSYIGSDAFAFTAYYSNDDNWEKTGPYNSMALYIGKHLITMNKYGYFDSYSIREGTKTIAGGAFYDCSDMTSVIIPESVTSIGAGAFRNCSSLTSVELPSGIKIIDDGTFAGCSSLKSISIPSGVESIGMEAFCDCSSLKSISIPLGVESIGAEAFYGCSSLESITVPEGVISIGYSAFRDCEALATVVIPDSINEIGRYGFENTALYNNESNWKDGVLYIGNHLIKANGDILNSSYTIKDGTKTIVEDAFISCYGLETIIIPDSVTRIGAYCFRSCGNLKSITIPENVISIGENAFEYCSELVSFVVDKNNKYYSSEDGVLFNKDKTTLLQYPQSATSREYSIPTGVVNLAESAFSENYALETVVIPDSVTSIGTECFYSCHHLETIKISGSVKNIDRRAFFHCYNMTSVKIEDGVESIGEQAFLGCDKLVSVTIPASVTDIDYEAFGYYRDYRNDDIVPIDGFTIYGVPGTAAETYAIENGFTFIEGTNDECWHNSIEWVIIEYPTVYYPGEQHKVCTECGEILETEEMPQLKCSKPTLKSASNSGKDVKISWGSVRGADYYYVYRKVSGGSYSYIGKTTKTSFTDDSAKAGKTYTYKVRAKNEAGYSDYSSTKTVKHLDQPSIKSPENTTSGVKISWSSVSGASGYKVYRKTSDGWKYLGKTSKTYFTDTTAKSGKKYTYTVKAYSGDYNSSYSSSGVSKYYLADPTLKTPSSTKNGITLKWNKITGAQGYVVYYKTGSGSYKKLTTVKGGSKVTYTHTKATKGKTYTYKVKAYKSKTYSAFSNAKKIKDKY